MSEVRIVIADDHRLMREGIKALLLQMPEVKLVAEANDGREAVDATNREHPDIVLMDIAMPNLNGLQAADQIRREDPGVKVILLSMHSTEEYVWQAMRSGVRGYVLKDSSLDDLASAIQTVASGDTYLSPPISKKVVEDYMRRVSGEKGELDMLTPRQREILQLVAEGRSNREIAKALFVSVKTVETHKAQLMSRLGIQNVPGLVRFAIKTGLIPQSA